MLHQCRQQYHNHQHYQEERHLRQLAASNQPRSPLRQLFPAKPTTTTTTTTITTKMSAADSRKRIPWNGGSIPADACYLAPEVFEARCKYKYSLFKRKNNCHSYAIVLFHTHTDGKRTTRSKHADTNVGGDPGSRYGRDAALHGHQGEVKEDEEARNDSEYSEEEEATSPSLVPSEDTKEKEGSKATRVVSAGDVARTAKAGGAKKMVRLDLEFDHDSIHRNNTSTGTSPRAPCPASPAPAAARPAEGVRALTPPPPSPPPPPPPASWTSTSA